ncbi:hypothetical protein MPLDJ20_120437 [Mesorhizobium plurifarium]|uniref:Uncharacterized protein n=1 Tax=Mesorhizobium plurifarium TaxID=69974 RepID=A0A090EKS4_MESPL|nr:hypothetical protein MPLDJ20_120437 [Mesorhizobium plurifarium]
MPGRKTVESLMVSKRYIRATQLLKKPGQQRNPLCGSRIFQRKFFKGRLQRTSKFTPTIPGRGRLSRIFAKH